MANPVLLGTREVCQQFDIDKSTLTRWVRSGRIRAALKLPGRNGAFLFEPDEVERLRVELAGTQPAQARAS